MELLQRDPGFPQWTRAKRFDTFRSLGPVINGIGSLLNTYG